MRIFCLQCCDARAGWPFSLGRRGVLTHLVSPGFCCSPSSEAYLLLDVAGSGLSLNWVGAGARLRTTLSTDTAAMLAGDLQQLSATLKHLVAVVDRSVQRVPLDRIAYPCHGCQDRACRPSLQTPQRSSSSAAAGRAIVVGSTGAHLDNDDEDHGVFDADNSIPHIDSDPEDSTDRRVDNGKFIVTLDTTPYTSRIIWDCTVF